MTDLLSLQRSFAQTILGQEPEDELLGAVKPGNLPPDARLRIHQNNFRESLSGALSGVFPFCEAFVGEMFLKQALRHFALACPPNKAALFLYGADFPDFLRTYAAAASVPYLADVALLEWYTHALSNASEEAIFEDYAAAHAAIEEGAGLRLHGNARLLVSSFPVYDLWQVASGQLEPEALDISSRGGQVVLLVLHEGQVFYQSLEGRVADCLMRIEHGEALGPIEAALLEELIDRGAIALRKS